ncbi:MAG TPA: hypothetical protein VG826_10095 [Pirellulales bacterium]|nr:hypothetical protein [Pirellulales bacterium]
MLRSTNPYASPKADNADRSREDPQGGAKRLYFGWLAVFALNLIFPLLMAWGMTAPDGRIGMLLAIIVLLALGFWICASARQVGFALVVGGVAVALSQIFPILQMMAGILGFALTKAIGAAPTPDGIAHDGLPDVETLAAGFVITMTTGGLLIAASTLAGLMIQAVLSLRR